jgi:type VII secretion protein EccB
VQTRRDHLQAYQFAVGRMATALVTGSTGRGTAPTRRGTLGTFFGVLLLVAVCAGFGVYGLIRPVQKDSWRKPGSIIVEKETGNRYLMVGGVLRPVLNYASARLLTGTSGTVRTVSHAVLAGVPHGSPVGIPGAPDSLPATADVLSGSWTRCLRPGSLGEVLDLAPAHTVPVPAAAQAVLSAGDGTRYVLFRGVKYPVPQTSALIALGLDGGRPLPATDSWLARVPTGPALTAPAVPHTGRAAGAVASRPVKVGQLFRTPADAGGHTYVMLADGVAPVTATQSALLAARPGTAAVRTVDSSAIAAAPASAAGLPAGGLPDLLHAPQARTGDAALCLRQTTSGTALNEQVVLETGAAGTTTRRVLVPPGHGRLVVDQDRLRTGRTTRSYLVDDQGVLYPLGDAVPALRLSGPTTAMPEDVMALLPRGPVLDAAAAAAGVSSTAAQAGLVPSTGGREASGTTDGTGQAVAQGAPPAHGHAPTTSYAAGAQAPPVAAVYASWSAPGPRAPDGTAGDGTAANARTANGGTEGRRR